MTARPVLTDRAVDGAHADLAARAVALARERLADPALTVHVLARELNYSPWWFTEVFKRHVGATPGHYLAKLRVARARDLLATTDLPIRAVARRCGFRHATTLSAAFRRATGETPHRWRRLVGASHVVTSDR